MKWTSHNRYSLKCSAHAAIIKLITEQRESWWILKNRSESIGISKHLTRTPVNALSHAPTTPLHQDEVAAKEQLLLLRNYYYYLTRG